MNFHPVTMNWTKSLWLLCFVMFSSASLLLLSSKMFILEWTICSIGPAQITFPIILDPQGMTFAGTVIFISANVMHFATTYMKTERFLSRFTHLVLLFILSMNMLIFFPHMITLLLGWDGLGIVSFILVIYYENPKSLAAGMITALSNRIGDAMLLLSVGWTLNQGHWLITNMWTSPFDDLLIFSILVAAMTKSAQMPFSSWLPAAMAAPTPVSALVHSSTLVTAGVFLLIRFYPFLSSVYWFQPTLLIIACLTMLMAGMSATTECDMKKIIALSTLSQLGVMMSSLGLGLPSLALFHLLTHALFKALLFVCAGGMIHFHHHGQDLRTMGNLAPQMPLTISCLTVANLALCGSPFMAGFYSKDAILESALFHPTNSIIILMMFFATALTAAYSIRLTLAALWCPSNNIPISYLEDSIPSLFIPMTTLTLGAISGGATLNWLMTLPSSEPILPLPLKTLALTVTILGILGASTNASSTPLVTPLLSKPTFHLASCSMWFLTPMSSQFILSQSSPLASKFLTIIDQSWIESSTSQGAFLFSSSPSINFMKAQNNMITAHLAATLILLLPFTSILLLPPVA